MPRLYRNLFDLTGRVALVTGGSGGLGSIVAQALADYGAKVIISSRRQAALDKVAKEIQDRTGQEVKSVVCDATKEDSVKEMVSRITNDFGKIDILANFSGMNIPKPAEEYSLSEWEAVMSANSTAVFLCCREVGKVMIPQRRGKIINVSSVRSEYALPRNYLGYCATKAAVNMITKQLACEWARFNILVNAVAPTVTETSLTEHLFKDQKYSEALKARIPLGRWGVPDDLAGVAIFLASDASNFITGEIIFVDGGVTIW
ncbi:MAG: SDR family NAD(P)-dependent oxidoreductase [Nitrososphaerales archaeon]